MGSFKITKKHHKHFNNPFPPKPKTLPLIQGSLICNYSQTSEQVFSIGQDFQLNFSSSSSSSSSNSNGFCSLSISHKSNISRSIWATVPGRAFISAAVADTEVEESRGSFLIKDKQIHLICNHQSIDDIMILHDENIQDFLPFSCIQANYFPVIVVKGKIFTSSEGKKHETVSASYWLVFDQKDRNQVGFQVKLEKPNFSTQPLKISPKTQVYRGFRKLGRIRRLKVGFFGYFSKRRVVITVSPTQEESVVMRDETCNFNRVCLTYLSERSEKFYGFGEQFSHMNFKGRTVPIFVQEQGIGRGDQPITCAANLISYRAGGDESTTYAPSPFYMTSKMRSLYLEGYNYSVFDLTKDDRVQIQIHGDQIQGRILHGNSPTEIIERFTENIGRPRQLPDWIISGAVVGMQGGTETVSSVWDQLKDHDTPVSAFWLQDWVGQRNTVIGSQLWWNWEVDSTRYSGWKNLIKDLTDKDIKVMTYCNPCLAPMDEKPNVRRKLFEEAMRLDILVKDNKGRPYMVPNTAFDVGMLDLTHPKTGKWFKQILREMVDDGVRGWMADFGEGLPVDSCLYSGEDPIIAHNRYPEIWAKLNREFVEEWESQNGKSGEEALVFFMRAGFMNSPKWASLFWEGDQMVSWQTNDGIKSAVVGLLSSGFSGYAFNHSDIGGYCAVNFPFFKYQRSEELLLRWMELNAFTTVFRTHEGNKPSCNSQFYSNHRTLSHFSRLAKVYKAWKFYRIQLVKDASEKGLPVCRHLFLHYPEDEHVQTLTYEQFLVGSEILVAPVLDKGKETVKVYFPQGEICSWKHVWTGELHSRKGSESWVKAPIGYPAVFVKDGSMIGDTFMNNLRDLSIF